MKRKSQDQEEDAQTLKKSKLSDEKKITSPPADGPPDAPKSSSHPSPTSPRRERDPEKALEAEGKFLCTPCGGIFNFADSNWRYICLPCQLKRADHPQKECTWIDPFDGEEVKVLVDEDLVTIIRILNTYGFETINSCQCGHQNKAWIELTGSNSGEQLIQRIRNLGQLRLARYLLRSVWSMSFSSSASDDEFDGGDLEDELDEQKEAAAAPSSGLRPQIEIWADCCFRFPSTDLAKVTQWFQIWSERESASSDKAER